MPLWDIGRPRQLLSCKDGVNIQPSRKMKDSTEATVCINSNGSQRGIPPAADYRPDRNALERLDAIEGVVRIVVSAVAAKNAHQVL